MWQTKPPIQTSLWPHIQLFQPLGVRFEIVAPVYFPRALILDAVYIYTFGFMVRKSDIKANKLHWLYETIDSPGVCGWALLLGGIGQ